MTDPLDHDGNGKKGGSLLKAKRAQEPAGVRVLVADTISDGQGGHYAVGAVIHPTPEQVASLKAKGFVK